MERMVVAGFMEGHAVQVTWRNVTGDGTVVAAAEGVVAPGLIVGDSVITYRASFRTVSGAAIALMRALDEIATVEISLPSEVPVM